MEEIKRTREDIRESLSEMRKRNLLLSERLEKSAAIDDYRDYAVENENGILIWTAAFQKAVDENETVIITSGTYYVDKTVVIPSNRKIIAHGAHIKKTPEMNTLLLRNEHLSDGSYRKIDGSSADENISVIGGIWEDTDTVWRFRHGLYDKENSMPGISACMCFTNIRNLTVSDLKIIRAGGFGIQIGNTADAVIENITFENTVADGVHINGNTKNVIVRNILGSVGDDLVAFNAYDWSASSVCFGPIENLLCENVTLLPEGRYKAIRILPGKYFYSDGSISDCYIKDVIIKGVRGVNTFKFYFQTPPFKIGENAEGGESGWGDNLFIEDVELDLYKPIDAFDEYLSADETLGTFAAFEFGSQFGRVELSDIKLSLYKDKFPSSYLASIGPKSIRRDGKEIFDPYINSFVDELILDGVTVNGEKVSSENSGKYIKEISFVNLYGERDETYNGVFEKIEYK